MSIHFRFCQFYFTIYPKLGCDYRLLHLIPDQGKGIPIVSIRLFACLFVRAHNLKAISWIIFLNKAGSTVAHVSSKLIQSRIMNPEWFLALSSCKMRLLHVT